MISVSLHDADRLIAINGGQFLGEFKYAARFYILLIARVRDLLEKSLGYGIPIQVNRSTPSAWNVYIQSCVSDLKSSASDPVPLLKDTQTESL